MTKLRVLVTGGRNYDRQEVVDTALDAALGESPTGIVLIHGGASGADACANAWAYAARARGLSVQVEVYPAQWREHGKKAGPIRNQRMVTVGKPTLAIAFSGGSGTADCVRRCIQAGIPVTHIDA